MANKKSVDQHARLPASIIASDLTLRQFKVYAALSFFKGGNATCWPKIATLCRMTHIDDRNLTRVLKELEGIGFIKRELRNMEGRATMYTLYEPDIEVFTEDDDLDTPATVATNLPAKLATTPPGQISRDIEQDINNSTKEQETQVAIATAPQALESFGNGGVNEIIKAIREECISQGYAYNKTDDRRAAHNLSTGKDFTAAANSHGMTNAQFAANIVKLSSESDFWAGKVTGPLSIRKHWTTVYNSGKTDFKKKEAQIAVGVKSYNF